MALVKKILKEALTSDTNRDIVMSQYVTFEVIKMDISKMCEKLISARGKRSQKEVANAVNISVSALGMYESGQRVPRDDVKERLAKYYGMTVGFLFYDETSHIVTLRS